MRCLFWFLPLAVAGRHHGYPRPTNSTVRSIADVSFNSETRSTLANSESPVISSLQSVSTTSTSLLDRFVRCKSCVTLMRTATANLIIPATVTPQTIAPKDTIPSTTAGGSVSVQNIKPQIMTTPTSPLTSALFYDASLPLTTSTITTALLPTSAESTSSVNARPSYRTSTTQKQISSSSTTTHQASPSSPIDVCYATLGGLQEDGNITSGCSAMLVHIQSCYNNYKPGDDLANPSQNSMFQACFCGTSKDSPFDSNSVLFKNFTGCAQCLLSTKVPSFDYMAAELDRITNFCRSQNPFPWLFYTHLNAWLHRMQDHSGKTPSESFPLTGGEKEAIHFTTRPPLANLAYGVSAPSGGSLAGVTPLLTTFTTMRQDPHGCCAVSATVTSLVEWVATEAGKVYNSASAERSENRAAFKTLEEALCDGRGPGQCGSSSRVVSPSLRLLWIILMVGAVLMGRHL